MAKQELRRKILATIATVGGLCCALAVCVWLLLTSSMFSTSIQILMLVCTGGLAAATLGLCIAKISEIRTLQKLVKAEALGLAHVQKTEEDDGHLKPLQTLDTTRVSAKQPEPAVPAQAPAPATAPAPAAAPATSPVVPVRPVSEQPSVVQPDTQQARDAQEAQARHWKPIDFSAANSRLHTEEPVRQHTFTEAQQAQNAAQALAEKQQLAEAQYQEELARRQAEAAKAAEAQRQAELARRQAEAAKAAEAQRQTELARRQAEAAKAAEAQRQAELARRQAEAAKAAEAQHQNQQWQAAVPPAQRAADPHRAEQIRLAQAARTGQIPRITDAMIEEQRLAAAARMAETQRMAKQGVSVQQPVLHTAPASQPVQTAASVQSQPVTQPSAKEQWVHS